MELTEEVVIQRTEGSFLDVNSSEWIERLKPFLRSCADLMKVQYITVIP